MLVDFQHTIVSVAEYMALMILYNEDPGEMCMVLHLISVIEKKLSSRLAAKLCSHMRLAKMWHVFSLYFQDSEQPGQ